MCLITVEMVELVPAPDEWIQSVTHAEEERREHTVPQSFRGGSSGVEIRHGWAEAGLQAVCTNWHGYVAPGAVTNGPAHFPVLLGAPWENSRRLPWMLQGAEWLCSYIGLPLIFLQNFKHHSTAFSMGKESSFQAHLSIFYTARKKSCMCKLEISSCTGRTVLCWQELRPCTISFSGWNKG